MPFILLSYYLPLFAYVPAFDFWVRDGVGDHFQGDGHTKLRPYFCNFRISTYFPHFIFPTYFQPMELAEVMSYLHPRCRLRKCGNDNFTVDKLKRI